MSVFSINKRLPVFLTWLLHLLDTALLPGVVPYPELLGSEATDPL